MLKQEKIDGMEVFFTTITPEIAEGILDASEGVFRNRKIRLATVDLYANDMANDRWDLNGETIKLTKDGVCIDGQNRLKAIIKSGKPQVMIVVVGVQPDAYKTIDIGLKRSLENALQFQGKAYETGASSVVRLRMTLRRHNYQVGHSEANMRISRVDQFEEFERLEQEYLAATRFGKEVNKNSNGVIKYPECGAIYEHLVKDLGWDNTIVENFFTELCSASFSNKTIFDKTMKNLSNKKVCKGATRIKLWISCWNSYISNCRKNLKTFKDGDWFFSSVEEKTKKKNNVLEQSCSLAS